MDDKLRDLLFHEFNSDEQRHFVHDYEKYLEHGDDNTKYIVNLDEVWKSVGFKYKHTAKGHLMKYYVENEDFILLSPLRGQYDDKNHGGHNKETCLLNVTTFESVCMTANTVQGKQTRLYYIRMKRIFQTYIKQTNATIIDELKQYSKLALEMQEKDNIKKLELQRHDDLIRSNINKQCVYLFKVDEPEPNTLIVKLGQTKNIAQRAKTLILEQYKNIILLDVFPCEQAHNFEQYLFKRTDIKANRIKNTELITLTPDFTYKNLITIIKKNIKTFENTNLETSYRIGILELLKETTNPIIQQAYVDELKRLDNNNHVTVEETPPQVSNKIIFKYHADDLSNPIDSFNSIADAARSLNTDKFKIVNVRDACKNNTQLDMFRFYIVEDGSEMPPHIPPTKHIISLANPLKGIVAKLDKENTVILKVYGSKLEAAADNNVKACGITIASKGNRLCAGHRWCMYEDCSEDLKKTYTDPLPTHISSTNSKPIYRLEPGTNNILEKFDCIQDVCHKYKICHKKINKLTKTRDIYKESLWVFVKDY